MRKREDEEGKSDKGILLDIVEDIGVLRGKVDALIVDRVEAANDRREMFDKLERMQDRSAVHDRVADKVYRMEPVVQKVSKLMDNINGGLIVIGAIGAILFTAIGYVLSDLWAWVKAHVHWR